MVFYPGPGHGGHGIPIDPFYLTWEAREFDHAIRFIEFVGEVKTTMPGYVVGRVVEALNHLGKPINGAMVLVVRLTREHAE